MATIMRKMNIISRCEAIYREKNSTDNLPGIYHSYILAICKNPGLPQEKLAKYLCINKSSVTRHLAYLEKNGYIKREPCPKDKREHLVYPTDKMHMSHSEIVGITKNWNKIIAQGISTDELELFHRIMDKMLEKSTGLTFGTGGDEA